MKILFVTGPFVSLREPYAGGTESFVVDLANALTQQGHTVDVIAQDTDEKNAFTTIGFPESVLSMKDNAYRPSTEIEGQRYYQSLQFGSFDVGQYDVIHYHSYIPEIYEMGTLHKKPNVLTLHVPPMERFEIMYRLFVKQTSAAAVAISQRMRQQWEAKLSAPIQTITNGIALEKWQMHEHEADGYLLWSGRIAKEKNIEAAIELANYLNRPLKIIGLVFDQAYFDECVKPALSERIEYIPSVSHATLNQIAAGASVFLATATWDEPFGLSIIEMLACGVPVVGFGSAIPPELRDDTVSIAVESDDWRDLIEPVETIHNASSQDCRAFAETFAIEATAEAYGKLYKELAS